ncbi:MAG: hypothetical protein ACP5TJ_01500 [Candidatus Micrarchaeia archaeon]
MAGSKDAEKLKKKLEALKRLQQTNAILQEGGVQNQVLQTSADDQWPSEDTHLLDLLEKSKIKAPEAKEKELEGLKEEQSKGKIKPKKKAQAQHKSAKKSAKSLAKKKTSK